MARVYRELQACLPAVPLAEEKDASCNAMQCFGIHRSTKEENSRMELQQAPTKTTRDFLWKILCKGDR
jgi:hypothetical protein